MPPMKLLSWIMACHMWACVSCAPTNASVPTTSPVQGIDFSGFVFSLDRLGAQTTLTAIEPSSVEHFAVTLYDGSLPEGVPNFQDAGKVLHQMLLDGLAGDQEVISLTVTLQREERQLTLLLNNKQKYGAFSCTIVIPAKEVTEYDKLRFQIYTLNRDKQALVDSVTVQRKEAETAIQEHLQAFEGKFKSMQEEFESGYKTEIQSIRNQLNSQQLQLGTAILFPDCHSIPLATVVLDVERFIKMEVVAEDERGTDPTRGPADAMTRGSVSINQNQAINRHQVNQAIYPYVNMRRLSSDALTPLTLLTGLRTLKLTYSAAITHLDFLQPLVALEELDLSHSKGLTSIQTIGNLTSLRILKIVGCTGVTDVQPLINLGTLQELHVDGSGVINTLSLSHLPNLKITGNGKPHTEL